MRKVELPLSDPPFCTYHYQGSLGSIYHANPSFRNWYYNNSINLRCNTKFIKGYTTPEVSIDLTSYQECPKAKRVWVTTKYLKEYTNCFIKNLLDDGFYITFRYVDDFYLNGKSWYQKRHFLHDGLIYGYDQEDKTFLLRAYNESWKYDTFKVPQKSFDRGRKAALELEGQYTDMFVINICDESIEIKLDDIYKRIKDYLNSSFDRYPPTVDQCAHGNIVHDYICMYLDKLMDNSIPYERMDWRIFRVIWEHKKMMHERICAVENKLSFDGGLGKDYLTIVQMSDEIRMMYLSYTMKRRDPLLYYIKEKLRDMKTKEIEILSRFIEKLR